MTYERIITTSEQKVKNPFSLFASAVVICPKYILKSIAFGHIYKKQTGAMPVCLITLSCFIFFLEMF